MYAMSHQSDDSNEFDFSRRTFMKASGVAAGGSILGGAAAGTVAAAPNEEGYDVDFANARVQEARKAWRRGFRGRADRSLAITDTGIEGRHPDFGGWNGVSASLDADGNLGFEQGTTSTLETIDRYAGEARFEETYTAATGTLLRLFVHGPFQVPVEEFDSTDDADARIHLTLTWEPANRNDQGPDPADDEPADFDMRLIKNGDQIAATGAALTGFPEDNRKDILANDEVELDPQDDYEIWVYGYGAPGVYTVDVSIDELDARGEVIASEPVYPYDSTDVALKQVREEFVPDAGDTPQIVGWANDVPRYGSYNKPLDSGGHGSHVSSIMAGSGQASAVDMDRYVEDEPRTVLLPGDVVTYEVTAAADTGVFASGFGEGFEIAIEAPDGRIVERSTTLSGTLAQESFLNNMAETETVHGSGDADYRIHFRANQGQIEPARVQRVACGAYVHHSTTDGDAVAEADGEVESVHAGVSPGHSLVGITGLGRGAELLAADAGAFAKAFNLRAVNMSWGYPGGAPYGLFGLSDGTQTVIQNLTAAGIVSVAAAGNSYTPANGNGAPAVVPEAISVVATGPMDGISVYSSGGIAGPDAETGAPQGKPDVTAIGGSRNDYDMAVYPNKDPYDEVYYGETRPYDGLLGTSMASPSVCGTMGLLTQAMEEAAPPAMELPAPATLHEEFDAAERREKVLRAKSILLATASETAFTAAPYHKGKAPTYTHGDRDPYEGYGRVNADAAVDAVSRDWLDPDASSTDGDTAARDLADGASISGSYIESVGLDVPQDSRAVAGYVRTRGGTLTVDLGFSHYSGGNAGMAKGVPHLDLFVYDPEDVQEPGGDPVILASERGVDGTGSVSVDVSTAGAGEEPNDRTLLVVAKIVNVPGVVNGYDVRAYFDLDVAFSAGEIPDVTTQFTASGSRSDDGAAFTGGQTDQVQVTVEGFENADEVAVTDQVPGGWTVDEEYGDVDRFDAETGTVHFEGTVTESEVAGDGSVTFTYFADAPEGAETTGRYTFGPAEAEVLVPDVPADDTDGELDGDGVDTFGGTDTNTVVGPSSNA
jgi:hypothetical protein